MLRQLARLIAPPTCVGCGKEGTALCESCAGSLEPARPQCYVCGRPSAGGRACLACRSSSELAGVIVATEYAGLPRDLVRRLKYGRQREAAEVLATLLTPLLLRSRFDVVTAVPIATSRLRQRGYNQAALIAQHVAARSALPYRPLLRRWRNTQQVGRSRAERLAQVKQLFTASSLPHPLRVLVVDDVLTTGATLNACALALRRAGAAEVWGAAATRD